MKKAVSSALIRTIRELQDLKSLKKFALAGGTNLALRYNHRESIDIDLFCPEIIGFVDPTNINDQFTFLRFYVFL